MLRTYFVISQSFVKHISCCLTNRAGTLLVVVKRYAVGNFFCCYYVIAKQFNDSIVAVFVVRQNIIFYCCCFTVFLDQYFHCLVVKFQTKLIHFFYPKQLQIIISKATAHCFPH